MLEYKLGYFATSLCGHDKGKVYMIVKQEGEMIGLSAVSYTHLTLPTT